MYNFVNHRCLQKSVKHSVDFCRFMIHLDSEITQKYWEGMRESLLLSDPFYLTHNEGGRQCCQFSDFFARFSNFSDPISDFFLLSNFLEEPYLLCETAARAQGLAIPVLTPLSASVQRAALSVKIDILLLPTLILHANKAKITAQPLSSLFYVYLISLDDGSIKSQDFCAD